MDSKVERILAQRARTADPRSIWPRPVGIAVALHGALLVAALVAASWPVKPPPPLEYVAVQVLPAPARGERRAPAPRPPAPQPEQKPAEPPPEPVPEPVPEKKPETKPVAPVPAPTPPPSPVAKPEKKPEAKPETKPETKPAPAPSSQQPAEPAKPAPPAGAPQGTATGTSRLGYQVLGFEGTTFPFAYYLEQVLSKVDDNWTPPSVEGPKALVFFRILRDGRVIDLELKESSGNRAFDLSALRAVTNASPLPPLPAGYREPTLSVHLIVR